MPTTNASPARVSPVDVRDGGYALVLNRDPFRSTMVRRCVSMACPHLTLHVCHGATDALARLRRWPAALGVISLSPNDRLEIELLGCVRRERLIRRVLVIAETPQNRGRELMRTQLAHGLFDSRVESPLALTQAIRAVAGGEAYCSPSLDGGNGNGIGAWPKSGAPRPRTAGSHDGDLFSASQWKIVAERLRLSQRELEIVRGVFENRGEAEIATELGVAPRTIHTHLERLHCKLRVHHRAELVLRIVREVLAPPGDPLSAG